MVECKLYDCRATVASMIVPYASRMPYASCMPSACRLAALNVWVGCCGALTRQEAVKTNPHHE